MEKNEENEEEGVPSLRRGGKSLRETAELSVPPVPKQNSKNLRIQKFSSDEVENGGSKFKDLEWPQQSAAGKHIVPGAIGPLIKTRVLRNQLVSNLDSGRIGKPKYMLELELMDTEAQEQHKADEIVANFDAGDSFFVLFQNPADEVDFLLNRLGLAAVADSPHQISTDPEKNLADSSATTTTSSTSAALLPPPFPVGHCTPRQLLSQLVDIRRAPSRPLIRVLANHAQQGEERRRLLELASQQGAAEFTRFVRKENLSFVYFLTAFPSVQPPLELIIDQLPRLLPRAYTMAGFFGFNEDGNDQTYKNKPLTFRFTYSLLAQTSSAASTKEEDEHGKLRQQKYGVCSQWLLGRQVGDIVQLAQKEPSPRFRLPPPCRRDICEAPPELLLQTPLWMLGPGTGVAPFIAFLHKLRHLQNKIAGEQQNGQTPAKAAQPQRVLIYASSCLQDEFLFKDELEQMRADGLLTELVLCESRPVDPETTRPQRIWDALKARGAQLADEFLDREQPEGLFFACGDVKNLSRELWACLSEILQKQRGMSPMEAIGRLKQLRDRGYLIEDVWS